MDDGASEDDTDQPQELASEKNIEAIDTEEGEFGNPPKTPSPGRDEENEEEEPAPAHPIEEPDSTDAQTNNAVDVEADAIDGVIYLSFEFLSNVSEKELLIKILKCGTIFLLENNF